MKDKTKKRIVKRIRKIATIIFLITGNQFLFAQDTIKILTLDSCIQMALANNFKLKADKQNLKTAKKLYDIQKGNRLPSINLEGQYMITDQYEDIYTYNYGFAGVEIYQPIWQNGKLKKTKEEAGLNAEESKIQFEINQKDISYYTTIAYINILKNEKVESLSNEIVKQFAITVDAAKERFKLGVAKRSDVLKAETEYSNVEYLSIQSRTMTNVSKKNLIQLMAFPSGEGFEIEGLLKEKELLLEASKLEDLIKTAYENLPEIKLIKKQMEKQEVTVTIAKKSQSPEIGAFANYNWTDNPFALKKFYGSGGLSIRLNVFNGFKRKNTVAVEKIRYEQLNFQEAELLQSVITEIGIAQLELKQAVEKINNAKKQVASSQEALEVTNEEYLQGLSSMLELINVRYANFEAQRNMINAEADYQLAVAKLKREIGLK